MYKLYSLLEHVFEAHPPVASVIGASGTGTSTDTGTGEGASSDAPDPLVFPIAEADKDDKSKIMKGAVKLVARYHSDRQANKTRGIEWYVLCEEITKRINALYSDLK
jgi:hypothetical protein